MPPSRQLHYGIDWNGLPMPNPDIVVFSATFDDRSGEIVEGRAWGMRADNFFFRLSNPRQYEDPPVAFPMTGQADPLAGTFSFYTLAGREENDGLGAIAADQDAFRLIYFDEPYEFQYTIDWTRSHVTWSVVPEPADGGLLAALVLSILVRRRRSV